MCKNILNKKINKILIFIFLFFLSISNSNAWIWLIAENSDILNITKWNEVINKLDLKLEKTNLIEWDNITLTDSWSNLVISATDANLPETPVILDTQTIELATNQTKTFTLNGSNFLPSSQITISSFDWTINSVNPLWEDKIEINISTWNNTWLSDIVVSNSGVLNTVWPWNWVWLLEVKLWIIWDDTNWRNFSDGTYASNCAEYRNPSSPYFYIWETWDWYYNLKQGSNPVLKVYCDMTTDGWGWNRLTRYANSSYYVEDLWNITDNFTELYYSYKRETASWFAFKFNRIWTKQCWIEHWNLTNLTLWLRDYVWNVVDWNWWSCGRNSTTWDDNDILTAKIIEWKYVDDACLNWNLNKTNARNYSWNQITDSYWNTVWNMKHRVSNSTVLFWPQWNWSPRCAWSIQSNKGATEVYIFIR